MFVQGDGYVAIGTARNTIVPVEIRVEAAEPPLETARWDRIELGHLTVRSHDIVVTGVTDNGLSGGVVSLEPGEYHVRALYSGLNSVEADGLDGRDLYVAELWPGGAADL